MTEFFHFLQENWKEVLQASSALTVAICAVCALYTWRKEFVGKRKIEFAAEFVEKAINMKDFIAYVRNGWATEAEEKEVEIKLKEERAFYEKSRLSYLVPKLRIIKNDDMLKNFYDLRSKVLMYFGKDALKIFELLRTTIIDININSDILFEDASSLSQEERLKYQKAIWAPLSKNDRIGRAFERTIDELNINLEPVYQDKKFKWKKLK